MRFLEGLKTSTLSGLSVSNDDPLICEQKSVDVVIVGAGMAGLSAAKYLKDNSALSSVILESSDRIGGRVDSNFDFGVDGPNVNGKWTVENGANWIIEDKDNPIYELAQQYQMKLSWQNVAEFENATYQYDDTVASPQNGDAVKLDSTEVAQCIEKMSEAYDCLGEAADGFWDDESPFAGVGALEVLQGQCGWREQTPMDFAAQWLFLDYEFAERDPSTVNFPFTYPIELFLVDDQRGFEYIPQKFAEDNGLCADATSGRKAQCNGLSDVVQLNERVTEIKYNLNVGTDQQGPRVKVTSNSGGNGETCTEYMAQRVISTVSAGVLNQDLIRFDPPLKYPAATSNPMQMQLYIKIFYQFPQVFWDDSQYIVSLKNTELGDPAKSGECHHWQNLDAGTDEEFLQGSRILFCTLTTEAYTRLMNEVGELDPDVLTGKLLDPLRRAYANYVEPINTGILDDTVYYPGLKTDADAGYGSYSSWSSSGEFEFNDYYRFFGGGAAEYCEHNGCSYDPTLDASCEAPEWTLVLSGAASCFEQYEFVHGAYRSGIRSVQYVLRDLVDPDIEVDEACDGGDWRRKKRSRQLHKFLGW